MAAVSNDIPNSTALFHIHRDLSVSLGSLGSQNMFWGHKESSRTFPERDSEHVPFEILFSTSFETQAFTMGTSCLLFMIMEKNQSLPRKWSPSLEGVMAAGKELV
jgi:hypothetical protein